VLDWSYDLLSIDEQLMLRSLASLDETGFSADAAIAAGEDAGCDDASASLSALFEKSLVGASWHVGAWVYNLSQTTRAYAASKVSGREGVGNRNPSAGRQIRMSRRKPRLM